MVSVNVVPRFSSPINNQALLRAQMVNQPPSPQSMNAQASNTASTPLPARTPVDLKAALGDRQNWQTLDQKLNGIAERLGENASAQAILTALRTTPMDLHPDASFPQAAGGAVTLEVFMGQMGLRIPIAHSALLMAAAEAQNQGLPHPLGDFGGGVSWPVPMADSQRTKLLESSARLTRPSTAPHKSLLDYLNDNHRQPDAASPDPQTFLMGLVESRHGKKLGEQLQKDLDCIPSADNARDCVLAAIHLDLDPPPPGGYRRNIVAGYDLAQKDNWGKPASGAVAALAKHLVDTGKTSIAMSTTAAHILLLKRDPAFLVKAIPDGAPYGSAAWVRLSIAAAIVEARFPGSVSNMTYAQVMVKAEDTTGVDPAIIELATVSALIDWGVVNGKLVRSGNDDYTEQQLTELRAAFNEEQETLLSVSEAMSAEFPSRKEMALAKLKERFGDLGAPFEEKSLTRDPVFITKDGIRLPPSPLDISSYGSLSMLDIAMMDNPDLAPFKSTNSLIPVAELNAEPRMGVLAPFTEAFNTVLDKKKAAISAFVRDMIRRQPPADRDRLEYGEISFYNYSFDSKTNKPILVSPNRSLMINTELYGVKQAYDINLNTGSIEKISQAKVEVKSGRTRNGHQETKAFIPKSFTHHHTQSKGRVDGNNPTPDSFSSARSYNIAFAVIDNTDLDSAKTLEAAKESTTLELLDSKVQSIKEFFAELIPFRSAIVNFTQGNYGEGAVDLTLDILGFLTAGAGAASKLIKVTKSAVSGATKILRGARVLGAVVLGELNPLSGVGDLGVAVGRIASASARVFVAKGTKAVNTLRGATGSYDLLKAASKEFGVAATGKLKIAGQNVDSAAVLQNGKWYAFDVDKGRPSGVPLEGFTPQFAAVGGEVRGLIDSPFGQWVGRWAAPPIASPNFRKNYKNAVADAKQLDSAGYNKGFNAGNPSHIPGYLSSMNSDDLKKLALAYKRTPEELGHLDKRINFLDALPTEIMTKKQQTISNHLVEYERGYHAITPTNIPGYSPTLNIQELAELATDSTRTPEEIGRLIRHIVDKKIEIASENFKAFDKVVVDAGGETIAVPQAIYLNNADLLSRGECAALTALMAFAVKHGKSDDLINKLRLISNQPAPSKAKQGLLNQDPSLLKKQENQQAQIDKFRSTVKKMQEDLELNFHMGTQAQTVAYTAIIEELAKTASTKTLLIQAQNHGILAGVIIDQGQKKWILYDPNFGLAVFPNEAAMRKGMEAILNNQETGDLLKPFSTNGSTPEYRYSRFQPVELENTLHMDNYELLGLLKVIS